ncbi:hypothetical protein ACWT_5285 [Actinoplanes sp. SE50]|uniref:hypothetical protein n=1 Tax=unclassified Actinoplanes TaxID=2626549 RepID=UPI00023EBF7C|nr:MULTISPECIES: hypothetical protein [unclassified Actinoplanes]AEV86303.1 hypothetical protein ACPL_5416 [Actinoplanes sp. SE50/110]ATO84700.1 hypothetical protein ACWT_5285 [Actinoplanes sp. SE50]SLM02110.1 hypothetical protein ACSP50_5348 [Actinoplanes sp. SE50/110]
MEENEFREALHSVLAQSPEPPPMRSAEAVAAGRRASRRRTVVACTGAVAALAAVTIVPARYLSAATSPTGYDAAAPAGTPSVLTTPPPSGVPSPQDTEPSWPAENNGDATADSGPRYQKGRQLLTDLLKVVPSGYTTPTGTTPDGSDLQSSQAALDDPEWTYLASVTVAQGGHNGELMVEVHEKNNRLPTDPCGLAESFWGLGGSCQVVRDGPAKVAVARSNGGGDNRIDQWAAYRYPDGVVVFVAQTGRPTYADARAAKLNPLPFTADELGKLALNPRFHLR